MSTFLFNEIIFGPVRSRRLGVSLGINLLPINKKFCNFNCIYCECGWSHIHKVETEDIPSRGAVREALEVKLQEMCKKKQVPDVITFAGNGEPTMHPEFPGIIDDCVSLRDAICPSAEIAVLTNSSMIHKKEVSRALGRADQNILKLDTVNPATFKTLNCPSQGIELRSVILNLSLLPGKKIIQTMFVRGMYNGINVDNTTDEEIGGLLEACRQIRPVKVMVYTFARDTAASGLKKVSARDLNNIANRFRDAGFVTEVSS